MILQWMTPFRFPLSEVFEFKQGNILQPKNKLRFKGNENLCQVIYSGDFSDCEKEIDIDKLTQISLPKPIKKLNELRKEDYLISAKGGIKGFSLYHSLKNRKEGSLPVAASNNLIVVRPKQEVIMANGILYMHNLLDLITQHLRKESEKPQEGGIKSQAINIRFLSDLKIFHTADQQIRGYQEKFVEISSRWEKAYDHLLTIKKELDALNFEIESELFKNLPSLNKLE